MKIKKVENIGKRGVVEISVTHQTYISENGFINHNCHWCKQMYHMPDNIRVPRAWLMSELRSGYFKPKEWDNQSVYMNAHPNCRHVLNYVPKNFGFDIRGTLEFKHMGYDLIADQRGIEKTENLIKANPPQFKLESFLEETSIFDPHYGNCTCGCNHALAP